MDFPISSKNHVLATTKETSTIGSSNGAGVRPQLAESIFTSHHNRETSCGSIRLSSSVEHDTSSSTGSSASILDGGAQSDQDNIGFNSGPNRAVEVPKLFYRERENPIESEPHPGINTTTSSIPLTWSSFVKPVFYSPERVNSLLVPSQQFRKSANSLRSQSAPLLHSSSLPSNAHKIFSNSNPMSSMSKTPQVESPNNNNNYYYYYHLPHNYCSHETVLTDLLEDFFFGGKPIPSSERYDDRLPLLDKSDPNGSNSPGSCCSGKKVFCAPSSPTTVTAICLCADDDGGGGAGGAEQQPLLLESSSSHTESYGTTPIPDLPKAPPVTQQIQRRTIFQQRSAVPFYPDTVVTFRRPFAQRSSSLSSLPSSTTTKISSNNSHKNSYHCCLKPSSRCRMPGKPALKRCSSLGKSLTEHGQPQQPPNKVSFGTLQFREYDIALSDHPGCSYGPPIQLGWEYGNETTVVSVDDYERHRIPRRSGHQLVISVHDRRDCLQTAGYSKAELQKAVQEVEKVKRQRLLTKATDKLLVLSRLDEVMEHCIHWLRNILLWPPQLQHNNNNNNSISDNNNNNNNNSIGDGR